MRVAIIPARGGSKRIPLKNIKSFFGKPIIAYSIELAIKSGLFSRVIVSTDSHEIADVAKNYGAHVPFIRPSVLADDFTGTADVTSHAIRWLLDNGISLSEVCCIYATAPLLQEKYLKQGLDALQYKNTKMSFSACEFSYPVFRGFKLSETNHPELLYPEHINSRSQDLIKIYHDAGQFYWGTVDAFLKNSSIFSPISVPIILPHYLVQDIDTSEDWYRAELLYQKQSLDISLES